MPSGKPATTDVTDDRDTAISEPSDADALNLAEAEADEAEAAANAARARANAIRLRQQSQIGENDEIPDATATENSEESTADAQPASAESAEEQSAAKPRRIGRFLRWGAAMLGVLAIGALVTVSVLMVLHHRDVSAQQQRTAEYAAAARQGVVTLMSLNFNNVDDDVKRIIDNSTGNFKKDFENQAKDFARVARDSKVITEANATAAAVDTMSDHGATVLVAATTRVTNASGAVREPRNWRLMVDVAREGDQIKISKVEFAP